MDEFLINENKQTSHITYCIVLRDTTNFCYPMEIFDICLYPSNELIEVHCVKLLVITKTNQQHQQQEG